MSKPVILDVDPGVDDALAILLALRSEELDVRAITVVNGNVPMSIGVDNALKVLELADRDDIPVYEGAAQPLRPNEVHAYAFHGEQGLGGACLPAPSISARGDAIEFLKWALRAEPGEVTVIALGPLTNLALAEQGDGILQRAKEVVVMGGTLHGPGNVAPHSEFNFFVDPVAARQVIRSGATMTLIPLDATRMIDLSREEIQQQRQNNPSAAAVFCEEATRVGLATAEKASGKPVCYMHDPLAAAAVIDDSTCDYEQHWIDVETEGELTAGQVVVDRRPYSDDARKACRPAANARAVVQSGVGVSLTTDISATVIRKVPMGRHHDVEFPGESAEYRKARDELLDRELELRRQIEAVAARRRSLPPGGRLKEDYGFEEGTPNSADLTTSSQVRLSDLFAPEASNSLVIYGFMFGLREDDALCPMCTSLFDSHNGARLHAREWVNLAIVVRALLERIRAWAQERSWHNLRLLSSANNN